MSRWKQSLFNALVLVLALCVSRGTCFAAGDTAERAANARRLYKQASYDEALAIWRALIDGAKKHVLVADGEAYDAATRCLEKQGKHAEAAQLFERYLKTYPKGKWVFNAHVGVFRAFDAAKDEARTKKAGKRIFKRYPDAKGTFPVLMTWLDRGWKLPKLATSYDVLHYWTFTRVDAGRDPERRLRMLDLLARWHKKSKLVKEGGILYCQAWCHMTAGRSAEAITLGEKYLRTQPRGDYGDRTRIVLAKAHLAASPPNVEEATKQLRRVANDKDSKVRNQAKDLLAEVGAGPPSIQLTEGYPASEGLGRIVVLTNLAKSHAYRKALRAWMEARQAEVVTFREGDVKGAAKKLRKHGAEFVAVVVEPGLVDNDFHLAMLELCRGLDRDPLPDFHFGYLTARDATDLKALADNILAKERVGGTVARQVAIGRSGAGLQGLDYFIHYGHGTARRVVKGISATEAAALTLDHNPVIFSGACFNGVCARTFESSILQNHHLKPEELAPTEVLSLAWIHAGATALFAALDGDRGEMAGAEWEYFLEHAAPLGEVMSHQYRLVFTSLRESYQGFPRYTPGQPKNKSFYQVMLRGQTSRILISDPMFRPLHAPLSKPTLKTIATHDAAGGAVRIEVEVLRRANGPFVNTLPTKAGTPFQEVRVYARVALPRSLQGKLTFPQVDSHGIKLTRIQAKHEIWGGRRYVNLQAESGNFKLAAPGVKLTYTFAPAR